MELRELSPSLLESLVDVVATLGELVATVAGPDGDVLLAVSSKSLHKALDTFMDHLEDALSHRGVTSLRTTLATRGATWADVSTAASTWQASVATVSDKWTRLPMEATKLRDACRDAATTEATTAATETARAGDLQDKDTKYAKAGDNLVATSQQLLVAMPKEQKTSALGEAKVGEAAREAKVAREDWENSVVATSQAEAATKRGQRAEVAMGPLERLVATCHKTSRMVRELWRQLGDIEATLVGTKEAFPDVPEALVAKVADAERLWEASADMAKYHLLDTLDVIRGLLPSGPGGPGGRAVAERCQKAFEDIPRLLRGE